MKSSIPIEDWFIFRNESVTGYLKEVLKEIRWKENDDPFFRELNLSSKGSLVRELEQSDSSVHYYCGCGCQNYMRKTPCKLKNVSRKRYVFRLEADRGRRNMGHEFVLEFGRTVTLGRMDDFEKRLDLEVPKEELSSDSILKGILQFFITDVLSD